MPKTTKPPAKKVAERKPAQAKEPPTTLERVVAEHEQILARYATGDTFAEIGADMDPPLSALQIRYSIESHPELVKRLNTAIDMRAHWFVDEAAKAAGVLAKGIDVAKAMDGYMKLASLTAPKLYGTKRLEVSGPDGGPVETVTKLEPGEAYKRMLGG